MAGPLTAATIASICEHMNDDHAVALVTYARVFGKLPDARTARMTGIDAAGLDLEVETATGSHTVRITFDHSLEDAGDARATLIRMARTS
jgi:putative heme iron utilization protein